MPRSIHQRLLTRRRRRRAWLSALVALALVGPGLVSGTHPDDGTTLLVANRTLTPGDRIAERDVTRSAWLGSPPDDLAEKPVGRVVRHLVLEGEPIREARLGGSGGTLAEQLAENERALRLDADQVQLPAGVAAGDALDLIEHGADHGFDHGSSIPSSIASGARVLQVDGSAVTVAVDERRAPRAAAAAASGTLVALLAPAS